MKPTPVDFPKRPSLEAPAPKPAQERGYPDELALRAEALARIQQTDHDLSAARETIDQLKADLAKCHNRCDILAEERNKYRAEALVFRKKLVELATSMTNIGLLTVSSQELMKTVDELTTRAVTPTDEQLAELERLAKGDAPDATEPS